MSNFSKSDYQALMREYNAQLEQVEKSIDLMESKTLGVGNPITIPQSINEPTRRFIDELKLAARELKDAIAILESDMASAAGRF